MIKAIIILISNVNSLHHLQDDKELNEIKDY
jgi:hypothetical protein